MNHLKLYEAYVKHNKYEYGDYIVMPIRYYRTDGKNYLSILDIVGTPGPPQHIVNYYSAYVLYKMDNGILEELKWDDPMSKDIIGYDKEELEKEVLFSSRDIDKCKEFIRMYRDSKKYNI